jgi:hypothetical protein
MEATKITRSGMSKITCFVTGRSSSSLPRFLISLGLRPAIFRRMDIIDASRHTFVMSAPLRVNNARLDVIQKDVSVMVDVQNLSTLVGLGKIHGRYEICGFRFGKKSTKSSQYILVNWVYLQTTCVLTRLGTVVQAIFLNNSKECSN